MKGTIDGFQKIGYASLEVVRRIGYE